MTPHIPIKFHDHHFLTLLFCVWLTCSTCHKISRSNNNNMEIRCEEKERDALLRFKRSILIDRCGLLASWGGSLDCCQWHGIHCNNSSGHVTSLHLRGYLLDEVRYELCLEGKISVSLAELKHLNYLDLSLNNFQSMPKFLRSLANLEYLNLSNAGFGGVIPNEIGNLSRLTSLDLSQNDMSVGSLSWLSHLRLLKDINLSGINLDLAENWVSIMSSLPFLETLRFDDCSLSAKFPLSISFGNNSSNTLKLISLSGNFFSDPSIFYWLYNLSRSETSLAYLDLSFNMFTEGIPSFFWKITSLSHLRLSDTNLIGDIPRELGNMQNLSFLDLSTNNLSGQIPSELWAIDNLSYLSVADNQLEGPITNTISNLKNLFSLDLSGNKLQIRKEALESLGKLCRLQTLSLGGNTITYGFSQVIRSLSSCAHKSLVSLSLPNTQVWGSLPKSMSRLSRLEKLDLSSNQLNGVVSHDHFSKISSLRILMLSDNQGLMLNLSVDWAPPFQLFVLGLRSCKIGPIFPKWLLTQQNLKYLDISDARIFDIVPKSFWSSVSYTIQYLNMSDNMIYGVLPEQSITFQKRTAIYMSANNLSGAIPSFLGNNVYELDLNSNRLSQGMFHFLCPKGEIYLRFLDLSNNLFSETLPDCWKYFPHLSVLNLQNNNIIGNLPPSIATLYNLQALHLRNNSLNGELPTSWVNSTSLAILDLSYNSFVGYIPPSFGYNLNYLQLLSLKNNHFSMGIPSSLCQLSRLQILDLSGNHISGSLPKCLYNLTAMISTSNYPQRLQFNYIYDPKFSSDIAWFMWKRRENSFDDSLGLLKGIDISNNYIQGQIPEEISSLVGLKFLNLSQNNLSGPIPTSIGLLTSVEFLDLSNNHLSGKIPSSLASVDFLEILDLSKNNLSGKIPQGTQLQGFDPSSYTGNPDLCGAPLPSCDGDHATSMPQNEDNVTHQKKQNNNGIFLGLAISVVLGVITGFWGVCGALVFKRSWRIALFRFYDDIIHMVVVNIGRAWRRP